MPTPSSTSAQDINTEIGNSTTASVNLDETKVRNLACDSSGEINFAQCRWGINVPGGSVSFSRSQQYGSSNSLDLLDSVFNAYPASADAYCEVIFRSNGQMSLYTVNGGNVFNRTWLTSGSAGDYTIQFQRTSGDALTGGDSANTDHALSTTRSFRLDASVNYPGTGYSVKSTGGNLILKDSGGTLITRPVTYFSEAEVSI